MSYRYRPSRSKMREFANTMSEIDAFCEEHGIHQSASSDSYYFSIGGVNYRVSNHTVESSNRHAYNWAGEKIRDSYHQGGRDENTVYIHASKTRIREIYMDLTAGYILDGRGCRKESAK